MNVDSECVHLARCFVLPCVRTTEVKVQELSERIQRCINDWLENEEMNREHARQAAADRAAGI